MQNALVQKSSYILQWTNFSALYYHLVSSGSQKILGYSDDQIKAETAAVKKLSEAVRQHGTVREFIDGVYTMY